MANSVFNQLNRNSNNAQSNNDFQSQFNIFRQNPIQFLMQRNINIPAEMYNDPHSAVEYLVQNGRMNPQAMNKVMGTLQRMGFKF